MDSGTLVALTVLSGAMASLMGTVLAPIVLMWLTSRERRREKLEEYRREDEREDKRAEKVERVAADAARAARLLSDNQIATAGLLLETQHTTIEKTDEVARLAALTAAAQTSQLKQIHTLVNSDKTDALQAELNQTRITLALLRRFVALDDEAGRVSTADDVAAIKLAEANVLRLEITLSDRGVQLQAVEGQVAKEAKEAKEAKTAKTA